MLMMVKKMEATIQVLGLRLAGHHGLNLSGAGLSTHPHIWELYKASIAFTT